LEVLDAEVQVCAHAPDGHRSDLSPASHQPALSGHPIYSNLLRGLTIELDSGFCIEALQEALERFGVPEIFNTDQGAQFTSSAFTEVLKTHAVRISMDGRGRVQDNIFIERLWWTVKYHYVYLHAFADGSALRKGLTEWFRFYNQDRAHRSLDNQTPDEVYFALPHPFAKAA